jgi:hypothetical protein
MKRLVAAGLFAATLALSAPMIVRAEDPQEIGDMDQYEDAFSNPLRLAYYLVYPVGFTAEWLIMRPLHYLVSRPYLSRFFGYAPFGEEGSYQVQGEHMGEHM